MHLVVMVVGTITLQKRRAFAAAKLHAMPVACKLRGVFCFSTVAASCNNFCGKQHRSFCRIFSPPIEGKLNTHKGRIARPTLVGKVNGWGVGKDCAILHCKIETNFFAGVQKNLPVPAQNRCASINHPSGVMQDGARRCAGEMCE